MRNTYRVLIFLLVLGSVLALSLSSVALAARPLVSDEVGSKAYSYIEQLTFASRVAGTPDELAAAKMIEQVFSSTGYATQLQPFAFAGDDGPASSQNIIAYRAATKKPKTIPTPLVIVGLTTTRSPLTRASAVASGLTTTPPGSR